MGSTIEQIHREIETLKSKATEIATEAHDLYGKYLPVLGRLVSKQLIQAGYHLCTQAYPEEFLQLSLDQRHTLQQDLQKLGAQLEQKLQGILQPLQLDLSQDHTPQTVLVALEAVDQAITTSLRDCSQQANQLLQSHNLLEISSIDTLFEVAAKAEDAGRPITSTPHLLKALVETKDTEDGETDAVVAIYLKVTDVEFTDPVAMGWRNQLRQLQKKLMTLQRSFDKKQQEQQVAEAIAAWRSSWVNYDADNPLAQSAE